jgi:glycogen(starch) synthase
MLALQNLCNPGNRIPTITSLQGPLESFLQPGGAVRRLLGSAAAVVTVSEYLKTGVARAMPELCSKLVLIPNSLPAPELPPARLPLHPPVLLCLGRLVHEKGVDLALRAFAILRSRGSPARLVIAGDGEERMNLEALSHALGLSAHVTFTGWVPPAAVAGLINEATMLIVPSRWDEAFGLVNLQAAQMGRPVVAARTGGIPEVVLHGLTGLLVEREDVTGLADAVGNLLDAPESMATMGERARLRAETEFGFATYVDRHIALYREHALPCA